MLFKLILDKENFVFIYSELFDIFIIFIKYEFCKIIRFLLSFRCCWFFLIEVNGKDDFLYSNLFSLIMFMLKEI